MSNIYKQKKQMGKPDISVLIPYFREPDKLERCVNSLLAMGGHDQRFEILVAIDDDDPNTLDNSKDWVKHVRWEVWARPDTLGTKLNMLANQAKGDILFFLSQDYEIVTEAWPEKFREAVATLPNQCGILYPKDTLHPGHAAFPIITRKMMETVGYFMTPFFPYWFIDTWWDEVGLLMGKHDEIDVEVRHQGERGKSHGLIDLAFWVDVFNTTRPLRVADAVKLMQAAHSIPEGTQIPREVIDRLGQLQRLCEARTAHLSQRPFLDRWENQSASPPSDAYPAVKKRAEDLCEKIRSAMPKPGLKIAICVPSTETWRATTAIDVAGLCLFTQSHPDARNANFAVMNLEGSMISKSRNDLVKMALDNKCDYILWIDSVTADTPILVRREGEEWIDFIEACELIPPSERFQRKRTYEYVGCEVLTHKGWQKPRAVMQAQVKKPILRVTDERGTVSVTEDHSLFSNGAAIAGRDILEGTILDHAGLADVGSLDNPVPPVTEEYAEVLGFFAAEGTAGEMHSGGRQTGWFWSLSNKDKGLLHRYARVLESVHARRFSFVEDKKERADGSAYDSVWKLNGTVPSEIAPMYVSHFYTATGKKRIPKQILNAPEPIVRAFLRGYELGDGYVRRDGLQVTTTNSNVLAAGLHFLYARVGRDFAINGQREDKPEIVHMFERKHGMDRLKKPAGVRHIQRDDDFDGWVYDLNTEAGTFVGGVGLFVLHNSDMHFPPDSLIRLLAHKKDIVGATYNKKTPPFETLGRFKGEKPDTPITGGLVEALLLPGGMMLVKCDVYRKMKWPAYFESYAFPGETGLDQLKNMLRNVLREVPSDEVLSCLDGTPLAEWINGQFLLGEHKEPWLYFSEDFSFCRRARRFGYEIWCDLSLTHEIAHIGSQRVTCKLPGVADKKEAAD